MPVDFRAVLNLIEDGGFSGFSDRTEPASRVGRWDIAGYILGFSGPLFKDSFERTSRTFSGKLIWGLRGTVGLTVALQLGVFGGQLEVNFVC